MKPIFRVLTLVVLLCAGSCELAAAAMPSKDSLPLGSLAPQWQTVDLDGKALALQDLKGKVVVVDFWATWCGPCISEIPGYIALQKKYADQGLVIVGLSMDEGGIEVVRKFVKAHKMNYRVGLASDEAVEAYGNPSAIPTTFIIDREGKLRYQKVGAMPEAAFEAVLKPLL